MNEILNYIKENANWIFEGIGVSILTFFIGFFIKDKIEKRNINKSKNNAIQKNFEGDNNRKYRVS